MSAPVFPLDERGLPVMLADVPNSGVVTQSNATSGNRNHDAASGKFGSGGNKPEDKKNPANANIDPFELQRMLAAVRDAAREFDDLNQGDIRDFLAGRSKDPSVVDVDKFMEMVRIQRAQDLSDILDQQFRTKGDDAPGKRRVKLTAPRGYMKKAMKNLDDASVKLLVNMLIARGHPEEEVKTFFNEKGFESVQFTDEHDED